MRRQADQSTVYGAGRLIGHNDRPLFIANPVAAHYFAAGIAAALRHRTPFAASSEIQASRDG